MGRNKKIIAELKFKTEVFFHASVEMSQELYDKFKSLPEDHLVTETNNPELFAILKEQSNGHANYDYPDNSDFEEIEIHKYKNFPYSNETTD